jgi:hypothetical protein
LKAFVAHRRDAIDFRFRIPASRRSFMVRIVASRRTLGQLPAASPRAGVDWAAASHDEREESAVRKEQQPGHGEPRIAVVREPTRLADVRDGEQVPSPSLTAPGQANNLPPCLPLSAASISSRSSAVDASQSSTSSQRYRR